MGLKRRCELTGRDCPGILLTEKNQGVKQLTVCSVPLLYEKEKDENMYMYLHKETLGG